MKSRPGIFGGIFVLLFSLVFFIYSFQYPYHDELGPGPGFLPFWLSGILLVLSLVYIYEAWRGEDSAEAMPGKQGRNSILFILLSMVLYVALLPWLGFILTSMAFLFVLFSKGYKWYASLAISAVVSVFLFVLFSILLHVQLPVNAFGF